jgi:hypothetical protein
VKSNAVQVLKVQNRGKFPINFEWQISKPGLKKLFAIVPQAGDVQAGETKEVSVTFNPDKTLRKELKLLNCTSISMDVIEPLTGQREQTSPLQVGCKFVSLRLRRHEEMQTIALEGCR